MNKLGRSKAVPFAVAALGIATFAGMDVFMKGLSIDIGAYNAILWRTLIALVIVAVLFLPKRPQWPSAATIRLHVWRGLVTSLMAFLFFWGLVHVPLAEAIGLSFIAPLVALYLAAVLLKEKIGDRAIAASIIGLIGALVVIGGRLGGEYSVSMGKGIVAILLSAMLYAYNLILQRQQALIADPLEIAFFQNATGVAVYLLFAPSWALAPAAPMWPEPVSSTPLTLPPSSASWISGWAPGR